jgi:hypothetical protein
VTPVLDAVAKGMTLDEPYAEINTRTAAVRADSRVPAEEVCRQLAAKAMRPR